MAPKYKNFGPPPEMAPHDGPGPANYQANTRASEGWWDQGPISEFTQPSEIGRAARAGGRELMQYDVDKWGDEFGKRNFGTTPPQRDVFGKTASPMSRATADTDPMQSTSALKALLKHYLSGGG